MKSRIIKYNSLYVFFSALIIGMSLTSPVVAQNAVAPEAAAAAKTSTPITTTSWGHVSPDIKGDASIRYRVLPNGMKYALKQNKTPKNGASVRFHFNVGSIAEAENERGLAHFLEHMAFNGSKNVPEGEMVKILERAGLAFGPDTNATTSYDETVYKLELPKTDDATLDIAMMLMREIGSNLTITPDAVERERGIILSEKQFRNSPELRQYAETLKLTLPDTPFPNRSPIGTDDVLKSAPASRIRDFYERYYRPENATLILVGDFDVNAVEAKIKSRFADWKPVGTAGAPMNVGKVDPARPLATGAFSDPAIGGSIELTIAQPYKRKDVSVKRFTEDTLSAFATGIVSKRFENLSQSANAKLLGGSLFSLRQFGVLYAKSLYITPKEGEWKAGLMTGEQELRRALQFGFTQAELDEQLALYDTALSNNAKQQSTRHSAFDAEFLVVSLSDKSVITTPQTDLEVYQSIRPKLTLNTVNKHFRSEFSQAPNILFVATKTPIADAQSAIVAALEESRKVAVTAPVQVKNKAFAYNNFGPLGKIDQDKRITDLGIRTIRFANNVKLNIKKTDFEKGVVYYGLRFGNGLLSLSQDKGSFGTFMGILSRGGLKAHSFEELQRIMAGKQINFDLRADEDSFGSLGATTARDIGVQMKVLAAYITASGYRTETDTFWQNLVDVFAAQREASPQAVSEVQLPRLLASGDTRFGGGDKQELAARNMAEIKAVIEPIAKTAPIEIAIVGDVDEAAAIKAVAQSFGALPKRSLTSVIDPKSRIISFPKDRKTITLYHKGADDQGILHTAWPTNDNKDQKSDITRTVTAKVMGLLLLEEIREKLGATYSPSADSFASDDFTGFGYITASVIAAPDKMEIISAAIKRVTKAMRDAPVSEDLLLRARKPVLEALEKSERYNFDWLSLVNVAQSEPIKLDRQRNGKSILGAVTVADIQATARQYLGDGAELEVRIVNDKKSK